MRNQFQKYKKAKIIQEGKSADVHSSRLRTNTVDARKSLQDMMKEKFMGPIFIFYQKKQQFSHT